MKKRWLSLVLALALLCSGTALAAGEESKEVAVLLNGFPLALEHPALLERNTTLVPVEDFCAAAGAVMGEGYDGVPLPGKILCRWAEDGSAALLLEWKEKDRRATVSLEDTEVSLRGEGQTLYAPVRRLAKALGFTVEWDGRVLLTAPKRRVEVRDLAGLLNAIGSETEIILAPGVYAFADLDCTAVHNPLVRFVDGVDTRVYNGVAEAFDVTVTGVRDLTIRGNGSTIVTPWAYADVLRFENSNRLRLEDFTVVHDVEPGYCIGDCLELTGCADVTVSGCTLDGSGAYGLWAQECQRITLEGSEISNCTYGAAALLRCGDVTFTDCTVHHCRDDFSLFSLAECSGVVVKNCTLEDNTAGALVSSAGGRGMVFEGCLLRENLFERINEYGWEGSGGAVLLHCREEAGEVK